MNPCTLEISSAASADILEQADWFASRKDRELSQRWEEAVSETVLSLFQFPESGARCDLGPGALEAVRRLPVRNFPRHLIFYCVVDGKLKILRILHGARRWRGFLP